MHEAMIAAKLAVGHRGIDRFASERLPKHLLNELFGKMCAGLAQ
jgi:hypothetical protein